jgi:hypothetical protein
MQCGSVSKDHLYDPGWFYGELKWLSHRWSNRGLVRRGKAKARKWYKKQYSRRLRRLGNRHVSQEYD